MSTSTPSYTELAIMNAALKIVVILLSIGVIVTIVVVLGKRTLRVVGHNIEMRRLQRENQDADQAQVDREERLAAHVVELREVMADQQAALQNQADLLVQEGIRRPDEVYQIPGRAEY